jgi:hypothetical protein
MKDRETVVEELVAAVMGIARCTHPKRDQIVQPGRRDCDRCGAWSFKAPDGWGPWERPSLVERAITVLTDNGWKS